MKGIFTFSPELTRSRVGRRKEGIGAGISQVTLPTHLCADGAEEEVLLASSGKISPPTQQLRENTKSLVAYAT